MTASRKKNIIIALTKEQAGPADICDTHRCADAVHKTLIDNGFTSEILSIRHSDFNAPEFLAGKITALRPDCIFNLFEGFSFDTQKEAEFIKIIEDIRIPFTGSSFFTMDLCLDKDRVKKVLQSHRIPTPRGILVRSEAEISFKNLHCPLFIKPRREHGSVGIDETSLVLEEKFAAKTIYDKLKLFPEGLMMEEFISGTEYTVSLTGYPPYEVEGIASLDYTRFKELPPFMHYGSKWDTATAEFKKLSPSFDSPIDEKMRRRLTDKAVRVGRIFDCRSYFRIDFREHNGSLYVIDINPNPDISIDRGFFSHMNKTGHSYGDMIMKILKFAMEPESTKCRQVTSHTPCRN